MFIRSIAMVAAVSRPEFPEIEKGSPKMTEQFDLARCLRPASASLCAALITRA
jgi:hypothetical protein